MHTRTKDSEDDCRHGQQNKPADLPSALANEL
jgi:hypothetical protein